MPTDQNFQNSPIIRQLRRPPTWYVIDFFLSRASTYILQAAFNPTQIFGDEVTEEKGENARLSAFVGAIAVGDLVKSTLGPKGMDKILQSAYVTASFWNLVRYADFYLALQVQSWSQMMVRPSSSQ
jgi:hypothetical protein